MWIADVDDETMQRTYGIPMPDRFTDRHDEPLWRVLVTGDGLAALDIFDEDGQALALDVPCDHPMASRVEIDPDEGIEFCGVCETERQAGRWVA